MAVQFNAAVSNMRAQWPAISALATTGALSISAWIYFPDATARDTASQVIVRLEHASNTNCVQLLWDAKILTFIRRGDIDTQTATWNASTTAVSTAAWHHVCVVHGGSYPDYQTDTKLYVDGVDVTEAFVSAIATGYDAPNGVINWCNNAGLSAPGKMAIRDCGVWTVALSAANVTSLAAGADPVDIQPQYLQHAPAFITDAASGAISNAVDAIGGQLATLSNSPVNLVSVHTPVSSPVYPYGTPPSAVTTSCVSWISSGKPLYAGRCRAGTAGAAYSTYDRIQWLKSVVGDGTGHLSTAANTSWPGWLAGLGQLGPCVSFDLNSSGNSFSMGNAGFSTNATNFTSDASFLLVIGAGTHTHNNTAPSQTTVSYCGNWIVGYKLNGSNTPGYLWVTDNNSHSVFFDLPVDCKKCVIGICCKSGAGNGSVYVNMNGTTSTQSSLTMSPSASKTHNLGATTASTGMPGQIKVYEVLRYSADVTASMPTIVNYFMGVHGIRSLPSGVVVYEGSSTIGGQNGTPGGYLGQSLLYFVNNIRGRRMYNFAFPGSLVCAVYHNVTAGPTNGAGGAFQYGETVTQSSSGTTGKLVFCTSTCIGIADPSATPSNTNGLTWTGSTSLATCTQGTKRLSTGIGAVGYGHLHITSALRANRIRDIILAFTGTRQLVIQIGRNDFQTDWVAGEVPAAADIYGSLMAYVTYMKGQIPGLKVYIVTPQPAYLPSTDAARYTKFAAYVALIIGGESTYGYRCINTTDLPQFDNYTSDWSSSTYYDEAPNGIHMTPAGTLPYGQRVDAAIGSKSMIPLLTGAMAI